MDRARPGGLLPPQAALGPHGKDARGSRRLSQLVESVLGLKARPGAPSAPDIANTALKEAHEKGPVFWDWGLSVRSCQRPRF